MVVDGAIVVTENVVRHARDALPDAAHLALVIAAAREVARPMLYLWLPPAPPRRGTDQ